MLNSLDFSIEFKYIITLNLIILKKYKGQEMKLIYNLGTKTIF